MIFKTFDSDIDKISTKWGIFGKSFNDIGNAIVGRISDINKGFQATDDLIGSIKNSDSIWKRLYPSKETIQSQIIDVDSVIPKIDSDNFDFDNWINRLNEVDKKVKSNKMSWQDFSNILDDNQKWIAKWGEETQGTIRTQEGLIKANQSARASAIAHNAALKQQTLGAKAATIAMKGLAIAGNMLASYLLTKVITAYSDYKNKIHEIADESSKQASQSSEYVTKLNDLQKELKNGTKSSDELTSAFKEQLLTMGYTESEIDNLIAKYNGLAGAISAATEEALKNARKDAYVDVASTSKELKVDSNGGFIKDILIEKKIKAIKD